MEQDSVSDAGQSPVRPLPGQRRWRVWISLILAGVAVGVGYCLVRIDWTPTPRLYSQAREALAAGQYAVAEGFGRRLMARPERRAHGALITGESVAKQGRFEEAIELLKAIPQEETNLYVVGRLLTAGIECDDLGHPAWAEPTLRDALKVDPESLDVHERLAFILGLAGRSWEAAPHRLKMIAQEQFPLHHLSLLALGSTAAENPDMVQAFAKRSPDDVLVKTALARVAQREGRLVEAEKLFEEVVRDAPKLFAAQAWRAEFLVNQNAATAFLKWNSSLPVGADDYPDIWYVRGLWALHSEEPRVAVRCFWECLRRDASHQTASYQLSKVLAQSGETKAAEVYQEHARLLTELITAAKTVEISGSSLSGKRAADACEKLGLLWEAPAWREVLRRTNPRASKSPTDSETRPPAGTPRMDPRRDPTQLVSLAAYPLPVWRERDVKSFSTQESIVADTSGITFADQAPQAGVSFQFRNGSKAETDSEYMFEFSGGGVAALDYDLDGWPDLYFTQGSDSPPATPQETRLDTLFRNLGNRQFADTTRASTVHEADFSQGCAVGDFDNDGFPDLYVGNIGPNSFYHNNGDGTFTNITADSGTAGDRWTTSCAVADFNGDGLPDIFVANYLTGEDLFTKPCLMPDGSTRLCTPHEFLAAHDQIYINLGDGHFEDQSQSAGIEVPEGKGLGVIAASFDASSRLGLFIANDAVPNFYFVNVTPSRGAPARFEDQGLTSGLAVDADGQPQACMGVASGDPNGDGLLDIFVTNFRNESNTLYLQQPGGVFVDDTRHAGLREPSFAMLGFGTQFLDADLDGWEDLILTNGHVGNLKHHGVPYEMEPQFFRNTGGGKFVELPASSLGAFFAGKYLGRGMARIDWNRDGREDVAISHLKSPAALLTNQTPRTGKRLSVELRGVASDRDAIGSIVTVTAGGRKFVRHLTAGDGYQASNQRQLVFGLGMTDKIERLEVRWPNGTTQEFPPPAIGSDVLLIEGHQTVWIMSQALDQSD